MKMKKYKFTILCLCLILIGCTNNQNSHLDSQISESFSNSESKKEEELLKIKIKVNEYDLSATLESNASAKAFYELIQNGLTLHLKEYGGFEKVGPIGQALPSQDRRINAQPGDLILYSSNQFSLMYGYNSWSYTKLGTIDHLQQLNLSQILGADDVDVTFSI